MSSLARSLIEDPLARPEGSRKWPTFRKGGCSLRPVDRWPPTRNLYLRAARSVASEVPKRYSTHPARLNHATRDLSAESNTNRKRTKTQVQELERRNVLEEAAHLMLPGVVREEEEKEHLRTLLAHRTTWLRDVAVVAVVAGAILAAVADKETTLRAQNLSSKKETENIDLGKGPDIQVGKEAVHQVPIDSIRRGRLVENGFVYRQTFVVRSYEVGFDRTASIGTLANLFQETALNHVGMSDIVGDGMGTTHAMMSHRLIWVVTKMHIRIVDFPVWGDVVEIDSWVSESGKNGMRRDFLVRDYVTGQVRARATSHWAMMNQDSRKLSKMPDDVRAEITPYFLDRSVMSDESCLKIKKLDDRAPHVKSGLVPRLHDMDMNQHVNHVKYISWVLESVPQSLLVAYELMGMTLQYRKECTHSDVLCSLTSPDSPSSLCIDNEDTKSCPKFVQQHALHEVSLPPNIKNPCIGTTGPISYTHLLRLQSDSTEILRGHTTWRLKKCYS